MNKNQILISLCITLGGLRAVAMDATLIPTTQVPGIDRPQKASLGGFASSMEWQAQGMSRGNLNIDFPLELPVVQGPLLHNPLPTYNQENGLKEFGLGWDSMNCVERNRRLGEINFKDDDFATPFGQFTKGLDGFYYPYDVGRRMRMEVGSSDITIFAGDGTTYRFGSQATEVNAEGTYRYCMTEAQTLYGYATTFLYTKNASGRLFLDLVRWGGTQADPTYELTFEYQIAANPYFTDYRWGTSSELDRRVRRLVLKQGARTKKLRWTVEFGYHDFTHSPAFSLGEIRKIWPDGSQEPSIRLKHGLWDASKFILRDASAFSDMTKDLGALFLSPKAVSLVDFQRNGLFGFEHNVTRDWYINKGSELARVSKWNDSWNRLCGLKGPQANARVFERLRGADQTWDILNVVARTSIAYTMHVCNEDGQLLQSLDLPIPAGRPGITRFADLNKDQKPEMIVLQNGSIRIFENRSTRDTIQFIPGDSIKLQGTFKEIEPFWVTDVNGDGRPDILIGRDYGASVFYGSRNFAFIPSSGLNSVTSEGSAISLKDYDLTPVDLNGDGLKDLLALNQNGSKIFLQSGRELIEFKNAGLTFYQGPNQGLPMVGSFDQKGGLQIALADGRGAVKVIDLTQAEAGLLQEIDDGKGTSLSIHYRDAYPEEGIGTRQRIIAEITRKAVGRPDLTQSFEYKVPLLSAVTGRLLGYSQIETRRPQERTIAEVLQDENQGPLLRSLQHIDQAFGITQATETVYQSASHQGINFLRPAEMLRRATQGSETFLVSRDLLAYEGLCQTSLERKTPKATLRIRSLMDSLPRLEAFTTCLPRQRTLEGEHPNGQFDFKHQYTWQRNAFGLPTAIDNNGRLQEQMQYDLLGRLIRFQKPGQQESEFTYYRNSLKPISMKAPDGVIQEIKDWDDNRDLAREVMTSRGAMSWSEFYAFQTNELLSRVWDSLDPSDLSNPKLAFEYLYPSLDDLGEIRSTMILAPGLAKNDVAFIDSQGEMRAQFTHHDGWFMGLSSDILNQGLTRHQRRRSSPIQDLNGGSRLSLLQEGEVLMSTDLSSTSGDVVRQEQWLQKGVKKETTVSKQVTPQGIVTAVTEAGQFTTLRTDDGQGQVLAHRSPEGQIFQYGYDALGRLRQVRLPSGLTQTMLYNEEGLLSEVRRDDVGSWSYLYDSNRQLRQTIIVGRDGKEVRRSEIVQRDSKGRVTNVRFSTSQSSETFQYFYDGMTKDQTSAVDGQTGFLTGIYGRPIQFSRFS
jgi:YD repeat-containing protein